MLPDAIISAADVVALAWLEAMDEDEIDHQRDIVKAREYHAGEQHVFLTERLREYINVDNDADFNLNICGTVVRAVAERLIVKAVTSDAPDVTDWATRTWAGNLLDARQGDVYDWAVRDSEAFVIVDWDAKNSRPRFTPHQRYTSSDAGGDEFGVIAIYDDAGLEIEHALKVWSDTDARGHVRQRVTAYYPDRIEKYARRGKGWEMVTDADGEAWPQPWVDAAGAPLGVPVAAFRNAGGLEARAAWPPQDAINKIVLDVLGVADSAGFPILATFGFVPTTDGKPAAADGSNALTPGPGSYVGTTKPPSEASMTKIEGSDPTPLLNTINAFAVYAAAVTDTPAGRFQFTRQIASADSQKETSVPLLAKVRRRQSEFGASWVAALNVARKLEILYGTPVDAEAAIVLQWELAEPRDDAKFFSELKVKKELGVPRRQLWAEMGYSEKQIEIMLSDPEVRNATFATYPA